jgi:hypothetical protein
LLVIRAGAGRGARLEECRGVCSIAVRLERGVAETRLDRACVEMWLSPR